eukprot:TRINITY_DN7423_c0_g1_i4.p1 TRINITY_DN7423_c0_g1~~TRINITY_DN7423_c0_g1_i4.p1  ORF type:complete len:905 (+),score=80.65 TRINITY_DN7423_c0_g1_i4:105-2819(+)
MNSVLWQILELIVICSGIFRSANAISTISFEVQGDSSTVRSLRVKQSHTPCLTGVEGVEDFARGDLGTAPYQPKVPTHTFQLVHAWTLAGGQSQPGSLQAEDVDTLKSASASIANGMIHGQLDTDPDSSNETSAERDGHSVGRHRYHKHNVEHVKELNKDVLWYLMAICICFIAMLCIHLESLSKQASATRNSVESRLGYWRQILKLAVCAVGLNASMLFWGIAQEFMMTNTYKDDNGNKETLPHPMSLVICNRMMTVFFCGSMLLLQGTKISIPPCNVFLPAGSNLLASWFQYQSLAYVSFPLLTLSKSAKLLPVMVISSCRGKRHSSLEYAEAIVIVFSVVVFGFEAERSSLTTDSSYTQLGLVLLVGLLVFDSITPHLQDAIFSGPDRMSPLQITFGMACFASCIAFFQLLCSGALLPSVSFFLRHRHALLHLVVLSLCSTTTQFLISYTIKNFGPVAFSVIATTRQLVSVFVSHVLFKHELSGVAWFAAVMVFLTLLWRAIRPSVQKAPSDDESRDEAVADERGTGNVATVSTNGRPVVDALSGRSMEIAFLMCVVGMHVPMMFYSVVQEFLATHTFDGELFRYPLFLIAMNRTGATVFASLMLKAQGKAIFDSASLITMVPAGVNLLATFCQYQALYYIVYPAQVLMKSIKVIPVMLVGHMLRNRVYTWSDYTEGVMITGLVCFFMWNYSAEMENLGNVGTTAGVMLMLAYVFADSFTSNVEDLIYQSRRLDPAQLLLGMQATSGIIAWVWLGGSGQLVGALAFLYRHNSAIIHVAVMVLSETCGSYACTLTVKSFGPAVFTLLLIAHQIESFIVSIYLFNHTIKDMSCVCVAIVCFLILSSSMRRANPQAMRVGRLGEGSASKEEEENESAQCCMAKGGKSLLKGSPSPPETEEPTKS